MNRPEFATLSSTYLLQYLEPQPMAPPSEPRCMIESLSNLQWYIEIWYITSPDWNPMYINSNLYWGTLKKNCCYLPLWRRFSTDCFTDFFVVICMLSVWIPSLFSKGLLPASASLPLTGVINSNLPFGLSPVISWTLCNERFERVEPHLATFRDTDLLRTLPARARRVALLLRGCSRL